MATLNYAFKEISCKIVYYGCGLCGKTTNLNHIYKAVPGKFRGELVSLATEQDRTLFFDFLPLDLGEVKGFKTKFQLYTVPGQVYYNATRKLVLRGVDGIVFVADSQKDRLQENVESFENLRQNLEEYGYNLAKGSNSEDGIPWVLQLNKRDMPQISTAEEIVAALDSQGIPTFDAIAVDGTGVKETLKGISSAVIQKLNSGSGALATPSAGLAAGAAAPKAPAAPKPIEKPAEEPVAPQRPAATPTPQPAKPAAPVAAPAAPAQQQVPEAKPETAQPAASTGAPALDVTQACAARWRGSKTGSGELKVASSGEPGEYQLTGRLSYLGLFKTSFSNALVYKSRRTLNHDGIQKQYLELESKAGQDGPEVTVLVEDASDRTLFAKYLGFGGEITVSPADQPGYPE